MTNHQEHFTTEKLYPQSHKTRCFSTLSTNSLGANIRMLDVCPYLFNLKILATVIGRHTTSRPGHTSARGYITPPGIGEPSYSPSITLHRLKTKLILCYSITPSHRGQRSTHEHSQAAYSLTKGSPIQHSQSCRTRMICQSFDTVTVISSDDMSTR